MSAWCGLWGERESLSVPAGPQSRCRVVTVRADGGRHMDGRREAAFGGDGGAERAGEREGERAGEGEGPTKESARAQGERKSRDISAVMRAYSCPWRWERAYMS